MTTRVKSTQGEILITKEECLNRWKEHFSALLNSPLEQPDPMLHYAKSSPLCSVDLIIVPEVKLHFKKLHVHNRRAASKCCITAEMLTKGEDVMAHRLTHIFNDIWNSEVLPDDWSKGVILPFGRERVTLENVPTSAVSTSSLYRGRFFPASSSTVSEQPCITTDAPNRPALCLDTAPLTVC